jgi:LysR family transcriptional activator of glutamate synthase operon
MEIRQLTYLVLLAEERNFTRAAERGNVAQPALSRQIQKLEDELGVPLVDRTTRRAALTPAGSDLVERARRILDELDGARHAARRSSQLLSGRVVLGVTTTPGSVDIPKLLAAFHHQHPDVELAVREDLSVRLADRLRADELDLAIVSGIAAQSRRQLTLDAVARDDLLLVVPARHRLAQRRAVRVANLRHERFIAFPEGATIRDTVATAAARAGFDPRTPFESGDVARAVALVAAGLGVAVLPRPDAERHRRGTAALPFSDGRMTHELFVARRTTRRLSPAAARLLQDTRDVVAAPV